MRIINKTIRKSKIELKGGDGELGWKSKLPEVQMFKRFVENDTDFAKHSKLEVLSPMQRRRKCIQNLFDELCPSITLLSFFTWAEINVEGTREKTRMVIF